MTQRSMVEMDYDTYNALEITVADRKRPFILRIRDYMFSSPPSSYNEA